MFRSIESDHRIFMPFLEQGENLLATCIFRACSTLQEYAASLFHGNTFSLIGLTDKRIIVLPLSNITGRPIMKAVFYVPKENGSTQGSCFLVTDPRTAGIRKYWPPLGFNRLSGREAESFRDLLANDHKPRT